MSVFDLWARACSMKDCKKSATALKYHLDIAHNISSEQIDSITASQNKTCSKRKREYKCVVCPYPMDATKLLDKYITISLLASTNCLGKILVTDIIYKVLQVL